MGTVRACAAYLSISVMLDMHSVSTFWVRWFVMSCRVGISNALACRRKSVERRLLNAASIGARVTHALRISHFFRCSVSLCMHASISCFLSADLFLRSEQMVFAAKSGIHSFCVNTGINTTRSGRDDSYKRTAICSLFIRQKNSALNFSDNLTCVKASKRSLPRGMSASQVIGVIRSCNTLKFKIQENGS